MLYEKPIKRSKLRIFFGRLYYSIRKKYYYFKNKKYLSKNISSDKLEYLVFQHKSLIPRKLLGVDMQLQYNKFTNLAIAIKNINGIILKPGELFSYWFLIGRPKQTKGYKEGVVLDNGKYKSEIGGGLCQLSNLLFWMFLHTELDIVERHRHSYDVFPDTKRKVPFGTGATCYYPFLDLQIQNNTNNLFQIILYIKGDYLHGEIRTNVKPQYKYNLVEDEHMFQNYGDTFIRHNKIYREIFDLSGKFINKEFVFENNAFMMYNPTLVYNHK